MSTVKSIFAPAPASKAVSSDAPNTQACVRTDRSTTRADLSLPARARSR